MKGCDGRKEIEQIMSLRYFGIDRDIVNVDVVVVEVEVVNEKKQKKKM